MSMTLVCSQIIRWINCSVYVISISQIQKHQSGMIEMAEHLPLDSVSSLFKAKLTILSYTIYKQMKISLLLEEKEQNLKE